jgi:hypothetical protein
MDVETVREAKGYTCLTLVWRRKNRTLEVSTLLIRVDI